MTSLIACVPSVILQMHRYTLFSSRASKPSLFSPGFSAPSKIQPPPSYNISGKAGGDTAEFPDMGGGFLSGGMGNGGIGDGDHGLLGGIEDDSISTKTASKPAAGEKRQGNPFLAGGFFGGDGGKGSAGGDGGGDDDSKGQPVGGGTAEESGRDAANVGRGGGGGGGFPGGGLFSFMAPGESISTIDKFTEVSAWPESAVTLIF